MNKVLIVFVKSLTIKNLAFAYFLFVAIAAFFIKINYQQPIYIFVAFCYFELCNIYDALKKKFEITIGDLNIYPNNATVNFSNSEPNDKRSVANTPNSSTNAG